MKRVALIAASAIIVLSACTEKGPLINFGSNKATDTTYLTTPETPQSHNVLAEEFTGGACPNCPDGHEKMSAIEAANPDRVNIMAIHFIDAHNGTSFPALGAAYDFRTQAGTDIATGFYGGISALPCLGVDRITYNSSKQNISRSTWGTEVTSQLAIPNTINMYATCNYNSTNREAAIQVKVAYTALDTNAEFLTIAIVEDSLFDLQDDSRVGHGPVDTNYLFNHILRGVITATTGDPIPIGYTQKQPGLVSIRNYYYTLKSDWNPKHCKVVAFVFNSEKVMQSVQVNVIP